MMHFITKAMPTNRIDTFCFDLLYMFNITWMQFIAYGVDTHARMHTHYTDLPHKNNIQKPSVWPMWTCFKKETL